MAGSPVSNPLKVLQLLTNLYFYVKTVGGGGVELPTVLVDHEEVPFYRFFGHKITNLFLNVNRASHSPSNMLIRHAI